MRRLYPLIFLPALLSACAGAPTFDTRQVDRSLTPKSVGAELEHSTGKTVLWGGVILATVNLKDSTRIEVLAYPLDANALPLAEQDPLGRFIIEHRGYLESASYTQGRWVTVLGTVTRSQTGKIGESVYTYPLIADRQLHLWPRHSMRDKTDLHFGIGVGIIF